MDFTPIYTRTDQGGLSQGLSTPLAMCFILTSYDRVVSFVIPHQKDQEPRLIEFMKLHGPAEIPTCASGFEKAFIQHRNHSVSRLTLSWDRREAGGADSWLPGSCVRTVFKIPHD